MYNYSFTFGLLFLTLPLLAQTQELSTKSEQFFWLKFHHELLYILKVPTIQESPYTEEFRFQDDYKLIRIWKEGEEVKGMVHFFLKEYLQDVKKRDKERIYQSFLHLDKSSLQYLSYLIEDFGIKEMPGDKQIDAWGVGFDGITYFISQRNEESWAFKSYWTPSAFPHLKEARTLQYFIHEINALEPIHKGMQQFMKNQPFSCYYAGYGSATVGCIVRRK